MFEGLFPSTTGQGPGVLEDVGAALADPRIQSSLLQFGLQAMQPVALGQTPGGHIAQAVGAGGEALGRTEQADLKALLAQSKLDAADQRMSIAEQRLNLAERREGRQAAKATGKKIGGLTDLMRTRFEREDAKNFERSLERDAKDIAKQANDILLPKDSPLAKYKGKTPMEIRESLRAERKPTTPGAASTPAPATANDDDDDEDPVVPFPTPGAVAAPPVQGARRAADGNWYVPDPKRQGKYLKVNP